MRLGRLELPVPEEWKPDRTEVRIAGLISEPGALGYDALLALADAVTATGANVDEPVVPVTIDEAPGFYAVESLTVDPDEVGLSAGWLSYEARLRPVIPRRRPMILSALTQTVRSNVNGVATAYCQHAVPAEVEAFSWMPVATAVQEVRATAPGPAGGGVLYRRAVSGTGLTEARWWVDPGDYYQGGCHVVRRVGDLDVPVVGRQSLTQPWTMTNGLVEARLGGNGRLQVRWWMPVTGGWTPLVEFGIGIGGGFSFVGWVAVEITSLTAEAVTIRAQGMRPSSSGGVTGRSTLWLTLRRGSRTVLATIDTDSVPGHRLTPAVATPVTDEVFDAYQTTAPAGSDGCHWVFSAVDNFGVNTGTGVMTPEDARLTWTYGVGAYFDDGTGDTASRDATMRDFYAARSEQVQIG